MPKPPNEHASVAREQTGVNNDTAKQTDGPMEGDVYMMPLEGGLYGACRVIKKTTLDPSFPDTPREGFIVVSTAWVGSEIPSISDPRLREHLRTTFWSSDGQSRIDVGYVRDEPPSSFRRIGQIPPTPEELQLNGESRVWELYPGVVAKQVGHERGSNTVAKQVAHEQDSNTDDSVGILTIKRILQKSPGAREFVSQAVAAGFTVTSEDWLGVHMAGHGCTFIFDVLASKGNDKIWGLVFKDGDKPSQPLVTEGRNVFALNEQVAVPSTDKESNAGEPQAEAEARYCTFHKKTILLQSTKAGNSYRVCNESTCANMFCIHNVVSIPLAKRALTEKGLSVENLTQEELQRVLLAMGIEVQDFAPVGSSATSPTDGNRASNQTDKGCFVATVCYGDVDAIEVTTLRLFRDQHLAAHCLGRLAIDVYYVVSPTIANVLAGHPRLRAFVRRALLQPLVDSLARRRGFQ